MDCNSVLDLIESKSKNYEISTEPCDAIRKRMNEFEICAVVIGSFSAGKSAMINSFLGEDYLREDQRPETAIPSEIVYDSENYVEAFSKSDTVRLTPDQAGDVNSASEYDYLRWHLRNEALAGIRGYTLVDMPGFNSNIEAHNRAILRYIDKASAYILVIDAEDGGIKQSMCDFLKEIRNYEHNTLIAVTKCDLKSSEQISEIVSNVSLSAEALFGETIPVVSTSKFDQDNAEKLSRLINGINRDYLYFERFAPMISEAGDNLISLLEYRMKNEKLDISELQNKIDGKNKSKKELEIKLKHKLNELQDQFGYQAAAEIMSDVQVALSNEVSSLAASLKSRDTSSFNNKLNSILRPLFVRSLKKFTDRNFDEFSNLPELMIEDNDNDNNDKDRSFDGKALTLYRIIAGSGAICTNIVAPWLEIALLLLPDLLKIFGGSGGDKDSRDNSAAEQVVRSKVIPEIISRLHPEVTQTLKSIQEEMVNEVQDEFKDKIENELKTLNLLKKEVESKTEEHDQRISQIREDVLQLRAALASLQA